MSGKNSDGWKENALIQIRSSLLGLFRACRLALRNCKRESRKQHLESVVNQIASQKLILADHCSKFWMLKSFTRGFNDFFEKIDEFFVNWNDFLREKSEELQLIENHFAGLSVEITPLVTPRFKTPTSLDSNARYGASPVEDSGFEDEAQSSLSDSNEDMETGDGSASIDTVTVSEDTVVDDRPENRNSSNQPSGIVIPVPRSPGNNTSDGQAIIDRDVANIFGSLTNNTRSLLAELRAAKNYAPIPSAPSNTIDNGTEAVGNDNHSDQTNQNESPVTKPLDGGVTAESSKDSSNKIN